MVRETKGNRPRYDLEQAKAYVSSGDFAITRRITRFILDKWDDKPKEAVAEIFDAVLPSGFSKSVELEFSPGTFADVCFAEFGGETWYIKFYVADGEAIVQMLSCNIDGYMH